MYRKLRIAPTPYCQCGPVEQTVSHILQHCPLLDQLRQTTWHEGATVRQKPCGMPGGAAAEDAPVCLVLGTASLTAIKKKKKKKKKKKHK